MNNLEINFAEEILILKKIFGDDEVEVKLPRLQVIFEKSEELWNHQIHSIPNGIINYLLIAEAPPWTEYGDVLYIYNPRSKKTNLIQAICKAFFGVYIYKDIGIENTFLKLAQKGFFLCDSIPFAMNYSLNQKRSNSEYASLVNLTAKTYLINKLNNSSLTFSPNLKVAFSVHKNGLAVIKALDSNLVLGNPDMSFSLLPDQIVVNGAWYPCANKIRSVFNLK